MKKTQQFHCGLFCPDLRTRGKTSSYIPNLVLGLWLGGLICITQAQANSSKAPSGQPGPAAARWTVSLPPLSAADFERLQRPEITQTKGRFRIGTGRVFDKPMVVSAET